MVVSGVVPVYCVRGVIRRSRVTARVFVDANIFIGDGRPPGKDVVRALRNLVSSGKISIISTDVTINEVTKHFTAHDLRSVTPFLKPSVLSLIHEVTGVVVPEISNADAFRRLWERNRTATVRMLDVLRAKLLHVDSVTPSLILDEYAQGRGVFSGSAKKDQFPDAFILKLLEVEARNGEIIVLSNDGDFHGGTAPDGLDIIRSIEELLSKLDLSIQTDNIDSFLSSQSELIVDLAFKEIEDFYIYFADNSELEGEILSVDHIDIEEIGEFETDADEILLTGAMNVVATVWYSGPDMSTASYDSEDKRAYAWREVEGEVLQEFRIAFTMTIALDEQGVPERIESMNFVNDGPLWVSFSEDYM